MGIYDREYYRKEGPSFLDSFATREVCKWLVLVNVAVWVLQLLSRQRPVIDGMTLPFGWVDGPLTSALLLDAEKVFSGQVWRLLTYAFLHDTGTGIAPPQGWYLHIIFNMWFLWMFGSYVEERYGSREFLAFYLLSALLGGVTYTLGWKLGLNGQWCLGASGAVTATMILCACLYPRLTILLFFVVPVPLWALAAFQVAQDSFGFLSGKNTRTAFTVHLAGAAFAFAYWKLNWRLTQGWPSLSAWRERRTRPRLRIFDEEEETPQPVTVAAPPLSGDVDEQLEAKLDAVLEKVARSGQGSLTDSERQILLRASAIYKKRRS
jgi:membrane associated rhomboid family serine protease